MPHLRGRCSFDADGTFLVYLEHSKCRHLATPHDKHKHGPSPNYIYKYYLMADRNADTSVDFVDTLIFVNQFNAQAGPVSVPEPTVMVLLAAGAAGAYASGRRRVG